MIITQPKRPLTVVKKGYIYPIYGLNVPRYAQFTGEVRPPRQGEWYLSGAIPQAYEAASDFDYPRPICKLVKARLVQLTTETWEVK